MLYDDVDVSVVDAKDTFGVIKMADPFRNSSWSDDSESPNANKSITRKSAPKWEFFADSKMTAKQSSKRTKTDVDSFVGGGPSGTGTVAFAECRMAGEKLLETTAATDFKDKVAVSFQEKLSVLEERDRYLRDSAPKQINKNMNVIVVGTCPDMCPEKERLLREIHCSFSPFEAQIVQNEMLVVPELLVKEYARSSADQDEPLPHELRPEPVLVDTMAHILANIVPRIEDGGVDAGEWYHFCWDRLRSVRKDIVQQQLCSVNIVTVLEHSARFHICCAERLFDAERRVFDHKINTENLVNCLQMLFNMYDDLAAQGIRCANESEFRVYMMLLLLTSSDVPELLDQRDDKTAEASRIYLAYKLNLYARFFKLVKRTSYLNACILQHYYGYMRTRILNVLVSAYSSGSQIVKFPIAFARKVLEFDENDETIRFVEAHGFGTFYEQAGGGSAPEIRCSKSLFVVPEQLPICKSSYIVRAKRVPILEAITGASKYVPESRNAKVHSSFDEFDVLREDAQLADDQRLRVVELYGNIYEDCAMSEELLAAKDEPMQLETTTSNDWRPMYSSRLTPEPVKVSSASASTTAQSTFSFANAKALLGLNFGSVFSQSSPSTMQFRFGEPQVCAPVTTSGSHLDFGATPMSTNSMTTDGSSSASVLYDPEYPCADDDECDTAKVPNLVVPVSAQDSLTELQDAPSSAEMAGNMVGANFTIISKTADNASTPIKPASPRKDAMRNSEEVAERLASALNTFQSLYYDREVQVVPASISESGRRAPTLSTRKLRKLVARRLRLNKAKKYARLWRKKVQLRKSRRDNFVGVVHLSPDEYFRLWGVVGAKERFLARSVVTDVLDTEKALRWSSALLRGDDAWCVSFAGDQLIDALSRVPGIQCRPFVCWKMVVSLPRCHNEGQRAFTSKVSKLVQALYYRPDEDGAVLGSVWSSRVCGTHIYVAANVCNGAADADDVAGVSCAVMFVCEKWEKWEELRVRLESLYIKSSYPIFVGAIVVGDSNCVAFAAKVSNLLKELRKRRVIAGCYTTTWKRWTTICHVVAKTCQRLPRSPPFQVRSVPAFVQQVGVNFFACLHCATTGETALNSPIPFIRAYNECLLAAARIVCMRSKSNFNLSSEFVEVVVGAGAQQKTNFSHGESIAAVVADFALHSFTKWPPKSERKMETLLTEYCHKLDPTNALLANVLRLIGVNEGATVAELNAGAPWLQIVELWFRCRMQSVSTGEYEKLFVIYSETEVNELIERMAIELIC